MSPLARIVIPAALLVAGVGCYPEQQAPPPATTATTYATTSVDPAATAEYWAALRRTYDRLALVNELLDDAHTPKRMATAMKDAAAELRDCGKHVCGLSVRGVDDDAVRCGAAAAEYLKDAATVYSDFSDFLAEVNQFVDDSRSVAAGAVVFVRIYLGDFLGPYKDLKAKVRQFDARRVALLERFGAMQEKGNRLDALELTARAALMKRYGTEFPAFAGLRDARRAKYQAVVGSIAVKKKKADGRLWDVHPFAAPEPFVKLANRATGSNSATAPKKDVYSATFDEAGPLVSPGDVLVIEAWDKDVEFNDEIGRATYTVSAEDLAAGKVTLSFGQVESLELRFVRK